MCLVDGFIAVHYFLEHDCILAPVFAKFVYDDAITTLLGGNIDLSRTGKSPLHTLNRKDGNGTS